MRRTYQKRRDVLCKGLHEAGWKVEMPKATMYVWAQIPEAYRQLGSLEFSKKLLVEAKVAVAPGIGFGALRRRPRALRADRERSAHAPGGARHQGHVSQGRIAVTRDGASRRAITPRGNPSLAYSP